MATNSTSKNIPETLNTFTKGIDADVSKYLIESSKYRDALNLRILTNKSSNTGELHKIEGSKLLFDLSKIQIGDEGYVNSFSGWFVFKSLTIRNYCVLFIKNDEQWAIVRFQFEDNEIIAQPKIIFQSNVSNGDALLDQTISVVINYENENTIKLYIANGTDYVHIINISKKYDSYNSNRSRRYSDYLSYSEITLKPIVFNGLIIGMLNYGSVCYTYRFITQNGVYSEFSTPTGLIDIADLNQNGTYKNGNASTETSSVGVSMTIPAAKDQSGNVYNSITGVQVYRIQYTESGQQPSIYLISELYEYDQSVDTVIYDNKNSTLSQITLEEFNISSGLHIKPTVLEYKKNYLFAANITNSKQNQSEVQFYDENGDTYYSWSRSWTKDNKYKSINNTAQEIVNITSLDNDENGISSFDDQNYSANRFNAPMWQFMNDYSTRYLNDSYYGFTKDGKYYGGTGPYIDYKFVCTLTENDNYDQSCNIQDVLVYSQESTKSILSYPIKYEETVSDVSNIYQYLDTDNPINTLTKTESYQNYSDPFFTYNFKSLRRDEVYRFGIIFYDRNNIATPVQWISDIRVPSIYTPGFELYKLVNNKLYIRTIQIAFNVKKLPKNAIAYEIVRCARGSSDRKTLTQGYLNRTINSYSLDSHGYKKSSGYDVGGVEPNDLLTVTPSLIWSKHWNNDGDVPIITTGTNDEDPSFTYPYELISPEIDYQYETMQTYLLNKKLYVEPLQYNYAIQSNPSNSSTWNGYKKNDPTYNLDRASIGLKNGKYRTDSDIFSKYNFSMDYGSDIAGYNCYEDCLFILNPKINGYVVTNSNQGYNANYRVARPLTSQSELPEDYKSNICATIKYYMCSNTAYYRQDSELEGAILSSTGQNFKPIANSTINTQIPYSKNKPIFGYFKVNDINYVNESIWSDYKSRKNKVSSINGQSFNNWIFGGGYDTSVTEVGEFIRIGKPFGPNGRCFVISIDPTQYSINNTKFTQSEGYYNRIANTRGVLGKDITSLLGTYLCNVQQQSIPYGGISKDGRNSSIYYSYGDYGDSTQVGKYLISKSGDTYPDILEHCKIHKWYEAVDSSNNDALQSERECVFYYLPCESDINMKIAYGVKSYNETIQDKVQLQASDVYNLYSQQRPQYEYNTVYSTTPIAKPTTQETEKEKIQQNNINTDIRCYYSNLKTNGEFGDSWAIFQSSNFLDVDSRYGSITDIKDFNNYLVFWQQNAVGRFSVQERSLMKDDSNLTLALGTGDILDRYDYFSYIYGMKYGQYSKCVTQQHLYWWDANKKSILQMSLDQGIVNLSKSKQITNIINNYTSFKEFPNIIYDNKYEEVMFNISDDTIVYNELIQNFSSRYSIDIESQLVLKDYILFTNKLNDTINVYQWNAGNYTNLLGVDYNSTISFIVNDNPNVTRVYDNQEIVGAFDKNKLKITYNTDLTNQDGIISGQLVTDRELNYRLAIPRANNSIYGNRMRGKILNVFMEYNSNDDFALYSVLTKYRQSWT